MSSPADTLRLVWIDLEMTGLNPQTDSILEIAAVVTGADLVPLAEIERVVYQPDDVLERMSDRVRRMHTENGLLEAVRKYGVPQKTAERDVLSAIAPVCPQGEGILSGNSIFHDWRFLVKHMPRLEQHLHFRQIDIGTLSVLVNSWYEGLEYPRGPVNHRAMDDIKSAIEELRYYCKHAFQVDLSKLVTARAR
jgi:oligoribonuclease